MTLTDSQHDRIKEIVLMALFEDTVGNLPKHPAALNAWKEVAHTLYETSGEFFALVNCTVQRIVEVLEAPSAVTPDRSLPPCEPCQTPLAAGGAELKENEI